MKELSIEEKAKAYDEALEIARQIQNEQKAQCANVMLKVFPELAESEDERIRKEIISALKYANHKGVYDKHLAWLEKQGEQKSTDTDYKFIRMRETKPKDISEFLDRLTTVEQEFLWEHIAKIRELDKDEQKPVWNEEVQEEQVSEEFINALGTMLNDGLHDRYPVSEERIKKSAELLFSIARKQLKNEMQEWSEEDERNLKGIIDEIEANKNQAPDYDLATYDRFLSWLKSLKPQNRWKPSDEQLNNILDVLSFDNCTPKRRELLESLYNDLEKLKGE